MEIVAIDVMCVLFVVTDVIFAAICVLFVATDVNCCD